MNPVSASTTSLIAWSNAIETNRSSSPVFSSAQSTAGPPEARFPLNRTILSTSFGNGRKRKHNHRVIASRQLSGCVDSWRRFRSGSGYESVYEFTVHESPKPSGAIWRHFNDDIWMIGIRHIERSAMTMDTRDSASSALWRLRKSDYVIEAHSSSPLTCRSS